MSTFFNESHIRQILQAVNIVEVISNYVALQRRGKELIGLCPFHEDRRPSLNVSESKQIFKCFACGAGGDAIKFIMLREQMSFPEAVRMLADRAGVKLPESQTSAREGHNRQELVKFNQWAVLFFQEQYNHPELGQRAREYVRGRMINEQTAQQFGLGWAPEGWDNLIKAAQKAGKSASELARLGLVVAKDQGGHYDRFRERLMFPVRDAMGRLIGFGGRTLGDDPAKYLNSPESVLFNKSRTLYGLDVAKDSIIKDRKAVIVEGYTDCIMAHQFGLTNVVATLGTALTREHAQMLSRYADRIVLVFDSDMAGQKAVDRALEVFFSQQVEAYIAVLPGGKDPCDFLIEQGKEAFDQLARGATEALEYKWKAMEENLGQNDTIGGHKRIVDEYLMLMAQLLVQENLDKISQGYLLNRVAKLLNISSDQVHEQVNRYLGRRKMGGVEAKPEQLISDSRMRSEQEILEVALNRPDLFGKIREQIEKPDEFTEPTLKQIAQRLWDYFGQGGSGSLVEIVGVCDSIQLCNRITQMAESGAERNNYEATLQGALENLQRLKTKQAQQDLSGLISQAKQKYGGDAEAALLMEIQSKHRPDARSSELSRQ